MNAYFGEPWGPINENQPRVDTPVGFPCLWCQVPVEEGDRGILMGHVDTLAHGEPTVRLLPCHSECLLRSTVGSPAHLDGNCDCYKPNDARYREQSPEEMRAEALEVWTRITGQKLPTDN